jgi:AcrR family transcriptional regulator
MREKLIQAAIEFVYKHGFHGLSMGKLASSHKIAVGNFYYHFKSKQDLIDHCYIQCKKNEALALANIDTKGSYKKQLSKYLAALLNYYRTHMAEYTFVKDTESGGAIGIAARMAGRTEESHFAQFIQAGIAQDHLRTINPELAIQLCTSSIHSLITQEKLTGTASITADIDDVMNFIWRGLKKTNKK